MTTLLLVRHGRTTANAARVLAGRDPGVSLDEVGIEQARLVGQRLADVPIAAAFSSPLTRCRETAQYIAGEVPLPPLRIAESLNECDYGTWTGAGLAELSTEELWRTVQQHPSAAVFPEGESMVQMSARAVGWARTTDRAVAGEHGEAAVVLAVSHGDIIKAIVADALGLHLDQFQRILVDPGSVTVIRYTPERPFVVCLNSTAGALAPLCATTTAAAPVGGGLGSAD